MIVALKGDTMRKFSSGAVFAVLGLSLLAAGCGQVANLQARMKFREANAAYGAQEWRDAVTAYEEVLSHNPTDPQLQTSYFFLGNSYDNLYQPSRAGTPAND